MSTISLDFHTVPANQPRVSIVVASTGRRESIDVLVDVVQRHARRADLEVLIVSAASHRASIDRTPEQPFVRHVVAPLGAEMGELRANGIRHANGDIVILLDGDRSIDAALVDSLLTPAIGRAD